jgi:repressor LexA
MNRIKQILEEKGIKQTWLADKLDKSYNMINSYVQNRRQPSIEDLYKIARILGVDARDLLDIDTFQKKEVTLDNENKRIDLIKGSNNYFLLRAKGNSMNEVGITDGDLVLVKQQPTADNGDFVVALIDDDATIKEFRKNNDAIVLKPRSTEQKHQPIILTRDFIIQGIVVATIPFND